MNEQNVAYTYNGILFKLKKEGNPDICYKWMNVETIMPSEISQSPKDILCFLLYEVPRIV